VIDANSIIAESKAMGTSKIKIKLGTLELEYEGESDFLNNGLLEMIQELQQVVPVIEATSNHAPASNSVKAGAAHLSLTTKSIATKLGAKSGSELAEAAVAHIALIKNIEQFKRADINEAMKSAVGIYKTSMTGNLTSILQTLLSQNVLVETGTDTYAITPEAESKLKDKLSLE
jgi:hypothetical protein